MPCSTTPPYAYASAPTQNAVLKRCAKILRNGHRAAQVAQNDSRGASAKNHELAQDEVVLREGSRAMPRSTISARPC